MLIEKTNQSSEIAAIAANIIFNKKTSSSNKNEPVDFVKKSKWKTKTPVLL